MKFIKYCIERETQNGCTGTESLQVFALMTAWLTGSCGLLPLPSITTDCCAAHHQPSLAQPREKIQIQIRSRFSAECISLLYHCKGKNILSQTIASQGLFVHLRNLTLR